MRKRFTLATILAVLFSVLGATNSAQAVDGTSVVFDTRQEGISPNLKLTNTNTAGVTYKQFYGTTRYNVATTCPPNDNYKLRYKIAAGFRFAAPGECRTWATAGTKPVGLFRADYEAEPPATGWPDASNTGFQGDASALPGRSAWRVTTAGAVIENVRIDASDQGLVIDAPNVTVRNVIIDAGIWGIDALHTADGLTVEDSTIIGGLQAGIGLDPTGGDLTGWTLQRLNVSGGNDALKPSGQGVIRDNYLHDLGQIGSDPHNDGMQFGDVDGVLVQHNMMKCRDTSCIAMFENQATFRNVTIDNNHMTGAGYILYAGGTSGSNIVVKNNIFGNWGWGPVTWFQTKAGNVWSNNVDLSGNPVNAAY